MKMCLQLLMLSAGACTLGLTGLASAVTAGRTVGNFSVSSTGAATHTIPIWAPPGPKGMQPKIALVYNSQSGNGYVGVGWNLAGLSSIYRCNLTFAQDSAPAAVSLSTSDGYCLDGQRLRLTSGTYGAAGSTYQTEIANFQNVTAYGAAGSGPAYFTVQAPDGRTLTYGNGGNSQVLASGTSTAVGWMLNQVSDPAANTMTISYSTATGAVVPNVISWTPTSYGVTSYAYTMQFNYGTNVLPTAGYVAGTPVQNPNLLNSITINYGGTQVKEYDLTYQVSGTTGRDRLIQVQECAASTSNCLSPTTIGYQDGSAGVSTTATTAVSSPLPSTSTAFTAHYDLNGDGFTDLVYEIGTTWYVAFGSASGYGTPVIITGITGGSLSTTMLVGDLLGTGTAGILAKNGTSWYYYTWNGSSFTSTTASLTYDTTASQFALADVNGDGLPDLVTLYSAGATVTTRLNNSSGATPSFSSTPVTAFSSPPTVSSSLITADLQPGNLRSFDFNGDGRQDLAMSMLYCQFFSGPTCVQYGTIITVLIAQTGGTFLGVPVTSNPGSLMFANVNNDACTDLVVNQTSVLLSPCSGSGWGVVTPTYAVATVMDWNGDGLSDLIEIGGSGQLYVQLSTATGLGTATPISVSYAGNCTYTALDANGDGLDELGCLRTASGTSGFAYYPHNGAGTPPDLLTSVVDGNGNSASPAYASIVQSNYMSGTGTYPDVPYISAMYVASQVTFSDPSTTGGTYNQTFEYYGSLKNLQGRGWDGFSQMSTLDSRDSVNHYEWFLTGFPYTGMQSANLLRLGTTNLSSYIATQAVTNLSTVTGQQRYFPYFSNVSASKWELGGPENGDHITTQSTNYTYDTYGNATTIATTTTDNDPGSPYSGDSWTTTTTNSPDVSTAPWCLNLLTQSQVTYTASIGSTVTRTKQFTPDLTNCRYSQVVTEPSSSTYKVTEVLGYDIFGNINSDAVTGIGMTARTTSAGWGTTGQFPMSVTDPSGALTQFNYDFSYGKVSSMTDPNNLTTSWQYTDGFGRKTQVTRPDGTYMQFQYYDCPTLGGCIVATHGLSVLYWVKDTGGTSITSGSTYYDPADRQIFEDHKALVTGTWIRNEVRYDSRGRLAQTAAPCLFAGISTPCPYWTTTSYDKLNRVTQIQRPISASNSTPQTTSYVYAGRTTTATDPNGKVTTLIADVNGWRRQTKDPLGYAINFGYDAAGAQTAVTDSLSNTLWTGIYAYGAQPFLTSETDTDRGAWSYVYDALGERTGWSDPKSQSFSETYDALSRPLTRTEPDLFSRWTWGSSAGSHNFGQLQSDCTGTGTACNTSGYSEAFTYDSLGRQYQRAITIPATGTFTYTWQYNATTGMLDTLTYPVSTSSYALQLQYGYQNGFLETVKDISDSPNVTVWTANTTDPAGQVTQETLGNGIVTSRTYDAVTHWLSSVQSGIGSGAGVQNQSFVFDLVGNVTQRQDGNLGLTENGFYDADYRLTSTTLNGTANLAVSYDLTGNITSRSDLVSGAAWAYDPAHKHQTSGIPGTALTYAYDANGNVTSRAGGAITWSSYNYPTSVTALDAPGSETVTFAYAPDRSRWRQQYSSVGFGPAATTNYIGGLMEQVISGGVATYRHYINAGSEPVAVYARSTSGSPTFDYFLSDHQGSVATITSSTGSTVVAESNTPFGARRDPATWSNPTISASGLMTTTLSLGDLLSSYAVTSQGYTFQTHLGIAMFMNHMNGRVEDSITGRFLSADPQGTNIDSTQSYNRYSYVNNNPLTLVDPTGFDSGPASSMIDPTSGQTIFSDDYSQQGQEDIQYIVATATKCDATCRVANTMLLNVDLQSAQLFSQYLQQSEASRSNRVTPVSGGTPAQIPSAQMTSPQGPFTLIGPTPNLFAPNTYLGQLSSAGNLLHESGVDNFIEGVSLSPLGPEAVATWGAAGSAGISAIGDGLGALGGTLQKVGAPAALAFIMNAAPGIQSNIASGLNSAGTKVEALETWAAEIQGELEAEGTTALGQLNATLSRVFNHQ